MPCSTFQVFPQDEQTNVLAVILSRFLIGLWPQDTQKPPDGETVAANMFAYGAFMCSAISRLSARRSIRSRVDFETPTLAAKSSRFVALGIS